MPLFFFLSFFFNPFLGACVHVIESEPGAGSRPGVQQPNKLSAQYQARPAGKKLCVCADLCLCDWRNPFPATLQLSQ